MQPQQTLREALDNAHKRKKILTYVSTAATLPQLERFYEELTGRRP